MAIKKNYLVQKRNILNEIRSNNMTLQELRFFSIYLSKIHKDKPDTTRVVRFPIADFQSIMEMEVGIKSKIKIDYMKSVTNSLLCNVVNVPNERTGGYTGFQLFKECVVDMDENGEWYVEIDAHDKALPLMFEFKNRYFSYQLWNALRLRSPNQLRMYEILKQYEKAKERVITVAELRELLGIEKKEYPRWERFRVRVLDACQQALQEHTDIKFTYEPHGSKGAGGKILSLKFRIEKNNDYIDQLTLEDFIALKDEAELEAEASTVRTRHDEIVELLSEACDDEFSKEEMEVLFDLVYHGVAGGDLAHHNYLRQKYHELQVQAKRRKIKSRFGYLKKIIEADLEV